MPVFNPESFGRPVCREHFPFFITAPDGWKNTIRHNLCFSNSFRKTPQQVTGDGKRKSCLWHLTLDGRRRLRNEIHTLAADSFRMLKRSMNYPGQILALAFRWPVLWMSFLFHVCLYSFSFKDMIQALFDVWNLEDLKRRLWSLYALEAFLIS